MAQVVLHLHVALWFEYLQEVLRVLTVPLKVKQQVLRKFEVQVLVKQVQGLQVDWVVQLAWWLQFAH